MQDFYSFFSIACTSSGAGCVFCNVNLEIDASAGLRYVISITAIASDGTLRLDSGCTRDFPVGLKQASRDPTVHSPVNI